MTLLCYCVQIDLPVQLEIETLFIILAFMLVKQAVALSRFHVCFHVFCVTAFTKSLIHLDSLSQPMLRRGSSGPASGSSLRELESDERRRESFEHWRLAFKQSDLDPPTGGCLNRRVRVGRSPDCTASLANYASFDITSYMIIHLLSHVHLFIIVTKSITSPINNFSCLSI